MIFINRAAVNGGQVQGNTAVPAASSLNALQACRYTTNSELFVNTTNAPAATDQYTQGGRFAPNGAMYVRPVETLGVPANVDYDGGLAFDGTTNALLVTTALAVRYINGWPLDQRGFVCMGIASVAPVLPGAFTFQTFGLAETILLSWDVSNLATSYDIYRDGVFQANVLTPNTTWTDLTSASGVHYSYTMFAKNASGQTASTSNPQDGIEPAVPATPVAPTAVGGNATATVTWVIPNDRGSTITSFTIQPFIGAVGQAVTQVPGGATTSAVVAGLTNGTAYTFKVAANNGVGQSAFSPASNAVTPVGTVPAAPTIGVATVAGVGQANLTFTANGTGGNPILDFLITSSPGAITWVRSVSPSFLAGLTPGIAYTFTVQARNVNGFSLPSAASNSITT